MRISNMLQFTEKHRFCVYRDFAMSPLQLRMLSNAYQPIIGGLATALFHTLYGQVPADKAGYSALELQRKLFLYLDLEQGERGRKSLIELTSKLEAVGLLQSVRRFDHPDEDPFFEYILTPPLSPQEFFYSDHLMLALHDKVGKHLVLALRDELLMPKLDTIGSAAGEDLSVSFYDLFRPSPHGVDAELEKALQEAAATKSVGQAARSFSSEVGNIDYADIIASFPYSSENRVYVEQLNKQPDQMILINFVASKYNLDIVDLRRLLDKQDIFNKQGDLQKEILEEEATLLYLQGEKRKDSAVMLMGRKEEMKSSVAASSSGVPTEKTVSLNHCLDVPTFLLDDCNDIQQYNVFLRNQPYTKVLETFIPNGIIPPQIRETFLRIHKVYGMADEVLNVLIHFTHIDNRSWEKFRLEDVASDMIGKGVTTFEAAVSYVKARIRTRELAVAKAMEAKERANAKSKTGGRAGRPVGSANAKSQKPRIPIATGSQSQKPTDAELEAILNKARKLDARNK
ncbi:helicase DnaB [Paenibacillus sp. N1-5-1-14]|uniref:helicase DnaB n=1 Tax=Paenibacillus radicibacter TaxID=2972488 RepID=UPI002158C22C|nr:helicase DnaB [Paenibacillus radicibacter]MCR8645255.1 helicase DnaB [Paenibacillus radicibacter]